MNFSFLVNTLLFRGTTVEGIEAMLQCLGSYEKEFDKGSIVFRAGDYIENMGLVLSGSVNIEIDDFWGNKTIIGHMKAGELFAETYACIPGEPLMVNIVSNEKSRILFMNASKLINTCKNSCVHHNKLIQNLFHISAQKNLDLSRRSFYISPKSIRGKLMSYLSHQAKQAGSYQFEIPFNRQQLADYLGIDRSALSNELSKMRNEGILSCSKNNFSLKNII